MSIDDPFSLPQPVAPNAEDSGFQVLVLARLAQIGEAVAQIHQLVSPPETKEEGESLREILSRMATALDRQGDLLETLLEEKGQHPDDQLHGGTAL